MLWRNKQLVEDWLWHGVFCFDCLCKKKKGLMEIHRDWNNLHDLNLNYMPRHIFSLLCLRKWEGKAMVFYLHRRKTQGFTLFSPLHQKESVCVEASIMQWSAINSTFWPAQQTKGQEVLFFMFVEYCFLNSGRGRQLRKQGQWISFRLLGGAWGLKDETGGRMGEVNASTLLSNRHGSLLTRLPCYWPFGRWYPLRLVDGGRVLWYEESGEKKRKRKTGNVVLFF